MAMDPPEEEDEERASLRDGDALALALGEDDLDGECGGGGDGDDGRGREPRGRGTGRDAPSSSAAFRPPARRSPRRPSGRPAAPSGKAGGPRAPHRTSAGGGRAFVRRHARLVLAAAGVVSLLIVATSRTEDATEADAATTKVARRKRPRYPSDEENELSSSSSKSGGGGGSYMGFHEASGENVYGANRYYKPRGVGYPVRPRGGLHPIYVHEVDDEEANDPNGNGTNFDDAERFDDDRESSPYADSRLEMTDEERAVEKREWKEKLRRIRDVYGSWNFVDDYPAKNGGKPRPVVDWSTAGAKKPDYDPLSGEIDKRDFPPGSWQTDDAYVSDFLKEGKALVKRVLDAIQEEYGLEGLNMMGVEIPDGPERKMIGGNTVAAWMYEDSFQALAKKLLKAMVTNDHFFVVLGGHSAAAGHGNNFLQSYMMEFQRVMEPVFDRLGMVLVSSNRAQGGMGTLQAALAGTAVYGEKDFMLWDSSMTERDARAQDVFYRQALLSGRRVPILFDLGGGRSQMDAVRKESGAHVGGVTNLNLDPKFKNLTIDFKEKKYNAMCWTPRVDYEPIAQNPKYGGQASWHPGNWVHQFTARKITMLFLNALDEALTLWEKASSAEGNPLDGEHWHIQDEERLITQQLRSANATDKPCGKILSHIPRVCTTPMRGAVEWSPISDPVRSTIRGLAKPAPGGYLPRAIDHLTWAYSGRDPLIPSQRTPKGEVDVAAIARSQPPKNERRRSLIETMRINKHPSNFTRYQKERAGTLKAHRGRRLEGETKIIPGEGWAVHNHPSGFCDGTLNSVCARETTSNCLMSGHNDGRGTMKGDGLSGWLVLQLKDVTEGIVMARMEKWHDYESNERTKGWTELNNGRSETRRLKNQLPFTTKMHNKTDSRKLKKKAPPMTTSFTWEVAVNGAIQYTWNSSEFVLNCPNLAYNVEMCLLWDDKDRFLNKEKEDIEFAMRLADVEGGRKTVMAITHIYYA